MTDEKRLEESVHAEEEDFEAHKKRALADEPGADDDSDDDFEAHKKRALTDEPAADDDGDDDVEAHRRRA